jgi:polar amino acid transport system substrate-binding protein
MISVVFRDRVAASGLFAVLGLSFFLTTPAGARSPPLTEVVVYADESYPPYSYLEQGQLKGIYPEIFRRAFEQMQGYSIQIKPVAWKRGLLLMEQGRGFALFPPYMRSQERPYLTYSDVVFYEETAVFCRADVATQKKRERWPDDFAGLRIAMNIGYSTGGQSFEEMVQKGLIRKDEGPGNRSNLLKLIHQRVDCYINDRMSIQWELRRIYADFPAYENLSAISDVMTISKEAAYLGISNRNAENFPFRQDFVLQLNQILQTMQSRGEIVKIAQRYRLQP